MADILLEDIHIAISYYYCWKQRYKIVATTAALGARAMAGNKASPSLDMALPNSADKGYKTI